MGVRVGVAVAVGVGVAVGVAVGVCTMHAPVDPLQLAPYTGSAPFGHCPAAGGPHNEDDWQQSFGPGSGVGVGVAVAVGVTVRHAPMLHTASKTRVHSAGHRPGNGRARQVEPGH